jgi:23S rRNA (cytidine2498-2'-O)-methyltransferase
MHVLLWAEDSEAELRSELAELPTAPGLLPTTEASGTDRQKEPAGSPLLACGHPLPTLWGEGRESGAEQFLPGSSGKWHASGRALPAGGLAITWTPGSPLPHLAFARQFLPHALPVQAESVNAWAQLLFQSIVGAVPDNQPWSLHVEPHYGLRATHRIGARAWHSLRRGRGSPGRGPAVSNQAPTPQQPDAGRHRCELIGAALKDLLQKKRRHLLRQLRRDRASFTPHDSLVQLLLTAPGAGFLSVAPAPLPFAQRHVLSPFPKGEVPVAVDKAAPSRAFAKLVEAELRLGRSIGAGESCVDLGAAPGSWSYVAVSRGARVLAVDRAPLREDLMRSRLVEFVRGDAFRFQPPRTVDWLLCDVIAAPERAAALLVDWLRRGWCRHFVVTLKAGQGPLTGGERRGAEALGGLKRELPPLTRELFITRLCANKREVCVFGAAR